MYLIFCEEVDVLADGGYARHDHNYDRFLWYNVRMLSDSLYDFISKRPHLIWYVKDYRALNEEALVEATLNYGDWDDVQEIIRIMGMEHVAKIFRKQVSRSRKNYRQEVSHYFNLYFDKYARTQWHDETSHA